MPSKSAARQRYYKYEDNFNPQVIPVITLEVMPDTFNNIQSNDTTDENPDYPGTESVKGPTRSVIADTKCLIVSRRKQDATKTEIKEEREPKENAENVNAKGKTDFLEYMTRNDGSVVCKLCGEILQSRTHWYRHKYKLHVVQPLNPAPLFQCEKCLAFFKSRKGYIGHIASRHSETLSDSHPVISSSQLEAVQDRNSTPSRVKIEPVDPELAIPKSTLPNYNNSAANSTIKSILKSSGETKKLCRPMSMKPEQATDQSDWEEKRSREEKLVADIIDRVRRECEAQGAGGPARRGYTRRTTVMDT